MTGRVVVRYSVSLKRLLETAWARTTALLLWCPSSYISTSLRLSFFSDSLKTVSMIETAERKQVVNAEVLRSNNRLNDQGEVKSLRMDDGE